MARGRKQPIDFRKEEVSFVMKCWHSSLSCSLIGVGSIGKSNLLQHLIDTNVHSHYLGAEAQKLKAIVIDPSMLGPLPVDGPKADQERCWAGYELMMHRLFMAFYPFEMLSPDDARSFWETYSALQDGSNPLYAYMGLRYFERGLDFFLRQDYQIVFMFDEFEEMARQMPVKFFQTLRGLRDTNKQQVSYLTFTRAPLSAVFSTVDALDVEPFVELFNDNTYYVGPYNEADARNMIADLDKRNQRTTPAQAANFLMWATGRYAGILRSAYHVLDELSGVTDDQLIQQLISHNGIYVECKTIWTSLNPVEQHVLTELARKSAYTRNTDADQAVASLVQKRLLRVDKDRLILSIEPPIFRAYIATVN